jgi:hypothetical protein
VRLNRVRNEQEENSNNHGELTTKVTELPCGFSVLRSLSGCWVSDFGVQGLMIRSCVMIRCCVI